MKRAGIGFRMNCNRSDAQRLAATDDPARDFTSIGDEHLAHEAISWPSVQIF
jgi:hypothetical protein